MAIPATNRIVAHGPLSVRSFENLTLGVPVADENPRIPFNFGAWDRAGAGIADFGILRDSMPFRPAPPRQDAKRRIEGEFIFGGMVERHYGHFLLETLSRAWALLGCHRRIVWISRFPGRSFHDFQLAAFEVIGIARDRHLIIQEPTEFSAIAIPDAGFVLRRSLHPRQAEAMGSFPFEEPKPRRRVWLSRSRMRLNKARIENEAAFEQLLIGDGWSVLHPETLSLREQLHVMRDAEILAGFDGSAFHSVILGRNVKARLIIIPRSASGFIPPTFQCISDTKNLTQEKLVLDLEVVEAKGRRASVMRIVDLNESFARISRAIDGSKD